MSETYLLADKYPSSNFVLELLDHFVE